VSIELDITEEVMRVLDAQDLSKVIVEDDIKDAVEEIVDEDYVSSRVDCSDIAEKVTDYIDVDDRIYSYLTHNCDFVESDRIGEYVVSEIDTLVEDYNYDQKCGTWRKLIAVIEDVFDHKIGGLSATDVENLQYTLPGLIREELKKQLAEPIRQMIIEELATHAVREVAQTAARQAVLEELNEDRVRAYVQSHINGEANEQFRHLIQIQFRQFLLRLANEAGELKLAETNGA
jgi:hypothetical protein